MPPPREEARRRGFTPSPRAWRRRARRPRPPSSPARVGQRGRVEHRDVRAVARQPAGDRVEAPQLELDLLARAGPRTGAARPTRPRRRNPYARPSATHTRAVPTTGGGLDPAAHHGQQVDVGRHRHHARRADRPHRPDDPRHPERARRRPVAVVPDHVPAAPPGHHAPRLHRAPRDLARRAAPAVVERDRAPGLHGGQQRPERGLATAHPRLRPALVLVDLDTRRAELHQRAVRGPGQLRRLPQPRGERHGGRLVGLQVDLAELVVLAGDAVAVGGVDRVPPALQRHAELAQLGLVALEHPEERLVVRRVGVAGHDRADALGRQELARGQQAEHEVHQTLCPCGGHVRHRTAAPGRCRGRPGEPGGRLTLRHPRGVT